MNVSPRKTPRSAHREAIIHEYTAALQNTGVARHTMNEKKMPTLFDGPLAQSQPCFSLEEGHGVKMLTPPPGPSWLFQEPSAPLPGSSCSSLTVSESSTLPDHSPTRHPLTGPTSVEKVECPTRTRSLFKDDMEQPCSTSPHANSFGSDSRTPVEFVHAFLDFYETSASGDI